MNTQNIDYSAIADLANGAPLYHQYPGQNQPQPAYIELDGTDLSADYNGEIGNAVPCDVWHGCRLRWGVSPELSRDDLLAFVAANIALFERVAAGHYVEWDGSNHVGRLTADARDARDELERAAAGLETDKPVIGDDQIYGFLFEDGCLDDVWTQGETLEDAAKRIEAEIDSDAEYRVAADVEAAILERALDLMNSDPHGELTEWHIEQLLDLGEITEEEAEDWHDSQ